MCVVCCYNKAEWFKQRKCITLHVCDIDVRHGSHWAEIQVPAGLGSLLEAVRKNRLLCGFQLLEAVGLPQLLALSSLFSTGSVASP